MALSLPPSDRTRTIGQYGVATLAVLVAFLVRYGCDGWLHDRSALDFFLVATAVSAWYGGAGPSALSILLSTLLGLWFFVPPRRTLINIDVVDMLETASFIFAGSAIAYLSCAMKRATAAARRSADEAHRELSERQRVEWELQMLNEQLEEKVDERTLELRIALRELEAYAYSIAHNLRAPLRAVAGLSDLLREEEGGRLSDEGRGQLARIQESTVRMDELIMGLLDYSRVSRGEFPREKLPLADAVNAALRVQAAALSSTGAVVDIREPLPEIIGHREPLVQVIAHLVSNALKFVAPGRTPRIRIHAEQAGIRVRLWVEDNGIGIDPRYHDRIFGVFERLHRAEEYRGTGIGLAIVRKCMERMGGKAGVESEPGKGSRFWIEAPSTASATALLVRSA